MLGAKWIDRIGGRAWQIGRIEPDTWLQRFYLFWGKGATGLPGPNKSQNLIITFKSYVIVVKAPIQSPD